MEARVRLEAPLWTRSANARNSISVYAHRGRTANRLRTAPQKRRRTRHREEYTNTLASVSGLFPVERSPVHAKWWRTSAIVRRVRFRGNRDNNRRLAYENSCPSTLHFIM